MTLLLIWNSSTLVTFFFFTIIYIYINNYILIGARNILNFYLHYIIIYNKIKRIWGEGEIKREGREEEDYVLDKL